MPKNYIYQKPLIRGHVTPDMEFFNTLPFFLVVFQSLMHTTPKLQFYIYTYMLEFEWSLHYFYQTHSRLH
jgi:hypothetical protein